MAYFGRFLAAWVIQTLAVWAFRIIFLIVQFVLFLREKARRKRG